jgi:Uma2 family endonuclease
MTATLIKPSEWAVLQNISWRTYQSLLADYEQEPAFRLTYDSGTLEIQMPRDPHEHYKKLIGRLIEAATEELELEIRSLGSRTCDREDLKKGLEPDQCYYIQNEPLVRSVSQIDLTQLPPPDLAVEIDISSSSLDRFEIYAKLGVPEVWRFHNQSLTIHLLQGDTYRIADCSAALFPLCADDFSAFLTSNSRLSKHSGENSLIRQFRSALRAKL